MIKKLLFTLSLCMLAGGVLLAQSTIKGKVKGPDGYGVPFLQVLLKQEGKVVNGAYTNDLGEYQIFGISSGKYDISIERSMTCSAAYTETGIHVAPSEVKFLDITIDCASTDLEEVVVVYVPPVFNADNTTSTQSLSAEQIRKSPGRSITRILANLDGVATQDGNITSVRGNRSSGHQTIIDGVRVRGSGGVPFSSIENLELISGGIPAEYGDGTSFAIITTRGVAKNYSGGVDLQASLEGYNQMMGAVNVSGPILKGKRAEDPPRMGFLFSAEGTYNKDPRPAHGGTWVAKPDVIKDITANPVDYRFGNGFYTPIYRANDLGSDAFEKIRVRQNAQDWGYLAQAKIDVMGGGRDARGRAKNNLKFSLSGTFEYENWENLPANRTGLRFALLNSANNQISTRSTLRLSARLNHRVKTDTAANAILKNVMYDVNVNYTLVNGKTEDPRFKDNFFQYGYVGKFVSEREDIFTMKSDQIAPPGEDTATYWFPAFDGSQISWVTYDPFAYGYHNNSDLVIYNESMIEFVKRVTGVDINNATTEEERNRIRFFAQQHDLRTANREFYQSFYGLLNGENPGRGLGNAIANDLFWAPGTLNSVGWDYSKSRSEAIGANLSLSLNLKNHEIKFGFQLEKLTNRSFGVQARNLWNKMRALADREFMFDVDNKYWASSGPGNYDLGPNWGYDEIFAEYYVDDTLMYPYLTGNRATFDLNFRDRKGIKELDTYLDIDSYDPNDFSLDLFSNFELLNNGRNLVSYSGYDYTGKISKNKLNLDLFFDNVKESDKTQYAIGAFEPVYMAWFLQDKFSISNLLFNVGLRVDYFNANQPVLKDPFLMREVYNVQELEARGWVIPIDNYQPDWIPYVASADNDIENAPRSIVAYRSGKTWYNSLGQEVTDPTSYLGAGGPVLREEPALDAVSKVTAGAFEDYKPMWNLMPRISFSFPVSVNSLFYAHYNIITYRPTELQINPIAYLYISENQSANDIIGNPNLRAERKIDYEIGFRQRVGENAALNFTFFYTENRDQVQSYRYSGAYPNNYYSYENQDFGTVQGLILGITMRGAKNFSFRAGYTLQFAKGTGSSVGSNVRILASGQPNLRTLTNLSYDQRHKISASINYNFDGGKNYNGPTTRVQKKGEETVKEIRWLEHAGASLMFSAASGMPYSRSGTVYSELWPGNGQNRLQGTINGANMPWIFQADLRIEKAFELNLAGKKKNESGKQKNKPGYLNVYLDFQNLLNIKNVINVYDYTGRADDDGYLASSLFLNSVSSIVSMPLSSAMNYYEMLIANPFNYNQPFRVKLGVQFYF